MKVALDVAKAEEHSRAVDAKQTQTALAEAKEALKGAHEQVKIKETEMDDLKREVAMQIPKLAAASAEHAAKHVKVKLDQKCEEIRRNSGHSIQAERERTSQYQHRCSALQQQAHTIAIDANTQIQRSREEVHRAMEEKMMVQRELHELRSKLHSANVPIWEQPQALASASAAFLAASAAAMPPMAPLMPPRDHTAKGESFFPNSMSMSMGNMSARGMGGMTENVHPNTSVGNNDGASLTEYKSPREKIYFNLR
jgi:hypothetical protein